VRFLANDQPRRGDGRPQSPIGEVVPASSRDCSTARPSCVDSRPSDALCTSWRWPPTIPRAPAFSHVRISNHRRSIAEQRSAPPASRRHRATRYKLRHPAIKPPRLSGYAPCEPHRLARCESRASVRRCRVERGEQCAADFGGAGAGIEFAAVDFGDVEDVGDAIALGVDFGDRDRDAQLVPSLGSVKRRPGRSLVSTSITV